MFTFASPVSGCSPFFHVGLLFAGTASRCIQWHHSLFGITTLQVYIYYQHYTEDKIQNRIVVCIFPPLSAQLKQICELGSFPLVCSVYGLSAFSPTRDAVQGFGCIPLITGNSRKLCLSRPSVTTESYSLESRYSHLLDTYVVTNHVNF
jgi:hypothetical protein